MSLRSNNVYAPTKRLNDFVDELTSGNGDTVLPIAVNGKMQKKFPQHSNTPGWVSVSNSEISSDHSVLYGMAIFKNGKLKQAMDGDNAMIFNVLNHSIENCTVTLQNKYYPDKTISFRLTVPQKMSAAVHLDTGEINISQDLRLGYLGGILPDGFKSTDELYSYAHQVLTRRIADFFTAISRTESADIMNLRSCIRKDFPAWEQWNSFDWNSFYKNAHFTVSLKIFQEV